MRATSVVAASLAILIGGTALSAYALEPREVFKLADASVVVLKVSGTNMEGSGSGVLVTPLDLITSCHVVAKAKTILAIQGNVQRNAKLRFEDAARDLCQLRLDDSFPNGRPVAGVVLSRDLEVGQTVYAIGAPRGLEHTLSRGLISALRAMTGEDAKLIQTDAAVSPGSSGGGLFDENAKLVGIVAIRIKESEGLNFAVPADWIAEVATRNRDRLAEGDKTAKQGVAPSGDASSSAAPREAWMPAVGDRWRYRYLFGSRPMGTAVVQIMETSDRRVLERVTFEGIAAFSKDRWVDTGFDPTRFLAPLGLPLGLQLAELSPYPAPDTEFTAGRRWTAVPGAIILPHTSNTPDPNEIRIVGKEMVSVPAGEFETWKVECWTTKDAYQGTRARIIRTYWYSPKAKRTVKMRLKVDSDISVAQSTETLELASFESKP